MVKASLFRMLKGDDISLFIGMFFQAIKNGPIIQVSIDLQKDSPKEKIHLFEVKIGNNVLTNLELIQ